MLSPRHRLPGLALVLATGLLAAGCQTPDLPVTAGPLDATAASTPAPSVGATPSAMASPGAPASGSAPTPAAPSPATPGEAAGTAVAAPPAGSVTANPGFGGGLDGWTAYVAPSIAGSSAVEAATRVATSSGDGSAARLLLSAQAQDNQREYISLGQDLQLDPGIRYRYTAMVRWSNPDNRLPSAIVSAWVRNGDGSYSGVDQWIDEEDQRAAPDGYVPVTFEFSPNSTEPVFAYLALLTHQDGNIDATEIVVDSLTVTPVGPALVDADARTGNLLTNGDLAAGEAGWQRTEWNPTNAAGLQSSVEQGALRLRLPGSADPNLLNDTWTGRYQVVRLNAGVTYELCADVDRAVPAEGVPAIVNIYAYKPETSSQQAWLGSVDYKFDRTDPHRYCQTFVPTETTDHQITLRVFGWGNAGVPIDVTIDDVLLRVAS
ncbi:MAG: hypothetical protein ACFCVG_16070 [Kineosporiaceae bacterium]